MQKYRLPWARFTNYYAGDLKLSGAFVVNARMISHATNRNHAGATWLENHARIRLHFPPPSLPLALFTTFLSLLPRGTDSHTSRVSIKRWRKSRCIPEPACGLIEQNRSSVAYKKRKRKGTPSSHFSSHRDVGVSWQQMSSWSFEDVFLRRYDRVYVIVLDF